MRLTHFNLKTKIIRYTWLETRFLNWPLCPGRSVYSELFVRLIFLHRLNPPCPPSSSDHASSIPKTHRICKIILFGGRSTGRLPLCATFLLKLIQILVTKTLYGVVRFQFYNKAGFLCSGAVFLPIELKDSFNVFYSIEKVFRKVYSYF